MTSPDEPPIPPPPAPGKKKWPRALRWMLGVVALISILWTVGVWALLDTSLRAPDWVRIKVEERINAQMPNAALRFDDLTIVVEKGWHPRLRFRSVVLSDTFGDPILRLDDVETGLSFRPLLRGQVEPSFVRVTGGQAVLRRETDGTLRLSVGQEMRAIGQAPTLAALVENLDDILLVPALVGLTQVQLDGISLRFEDMRADRAWSVDGARATLSRKRDNVTIRADLSLLGGYDYATTIAVQYESDLGSVGASFGVTFEDVPAQDIAAQVAPLAWLDVLRGPISGALRSSIDRDGNTGTLSGTLQIGKGALQASDQTPPIPFQSARSYFSFDPKKSLLIFDELSITSKWVSVRAFGQAVLQDFQKGFPKELVGQFRLSNLAANPAEIFPQAVKFEQADADFKLTLAPFRFELGQMTVLDTGQVVHIDGSAAVGASGWDVALNAHSDLINSDWILTRWPETAVANTRDWISQNVEETALKNAQFALRVRPGAKPETYLGFEFENANATYMKKLPMLMGASGFASLSKNRFAITATKGSVTAPQGGIVDVSGTSFIVPDVTVPESPAEVHLAVKSTVTAGLAILDMDPFKFLTKAGQPVTLADGRLTGGGVIRLPLKKNLDVADVRFDAKATLENVKSTSLIPQKNLAASALTVVASNTKLEISGDARIGQVPVAGRWSTDLGPKAKPGSRVAGQVELSRDFIQEFGIGLGPEMISGVNWADIAIALDPGRAPRFDLNSDLRGLGLSVREIGWSLPKGTKGKLAVVGTLGKVPTVESVSLDAPGLTATGRIVLNASGGLDRAVFDRVRAGSWLDAPVTLVGRGANRTPAVEVAGGWVDMRQTTVGDGTASSGGSKGKGGPITLVLDRLDISDGIRLTDFRGNFDTTKGFDGPFTAKVNAKAPIRGRIVPAAGRSAFRIQSDDAGQVFAAAGVLKKAHEGSFDLVLRPQGTAGNYDGTLRVENIRLREAPAMGALLNAVSIVGLLEQLSGTGILFSTVEADFRMTPKQVIVTKSSAVGASLGISMDGYYTLADGRMDMQGVFSPIYLINGIGSILTRKGEGLLGFNYKIVGTGENPKVKVNPLSIFTPGMFREIFRRPAPKVSP